MLGTQRRPVHPTQFVIFSAVNEEIAEHYAQQHDLVIVRDNKPFRPEHFAANLKDIERVARQWSFDCDDPEKYLAQRLEPIDTSKGDKL